MPTLLGIVLGIGLMIVAIILTSKQDPSAAKSLFEMYVNPSSFMIVFGGTIAATLIAHPFGHLIRGFKAFFIVFTRGPGNFIKPIEDICNFTTVYTKGGITSLEEELKKYKQNNLIKDAITMIINGFKPEEVRDALDVSISRKYDRETIDVYVFRTMARAAPAFGMVGTLVGLIFMLRVMGDNPQGIGPFLAVALITTFYGLILAHLFFTPMANKLLHSAELNLRIGRLILEGIMLLVEKKHPLFIKDQLSVFVPPTQRHLLYKEEKKTKK